jgi:hypothetical protein
MSYGDERMIYHEDTKNGNEENGNGNSVAITLRSVSVLSVLVVNAVSVGGREGAC